ncbi:extracellular solute-binding protein [Butyrivibrio sp. YAB3001]|uniref:extracellular solute-binding protein n=1 Tax=Butyrivibrio sp. YAB3001 TaxID=1520812 RepID=UPI0008F68FBC|nr:extracellular solute-binding protein [Butyrivibrio sp. YAB3001]SFC86350.1 ABC-type glycerol-3-phosphate transport system, substrate-binding protein [Butyrivibrio sp. YAB3001]
MKNKLFSIVIAFIFIFALIACGSTSNSLNNSDKAVNSDSATITVAARDGSHSDVINAVKSAFEQSHNCQIKIVSLSAEDIHDNAIADSGNDIGQYDVIMIDDPLMPEYIEKDILCNLTQLGYIDDEDFVEKSRLLGKDPYPLGATYALPFSGNVQLIFYNKELLGDSPDLSNWESILQTCLKVKASGNDGYAIRGQTGNPIVSDFLPILWAFGGDIFDENNNVVLDSSESRDALSFYCDLKETGSNYDKNALIDAVTSGKASIALGWPSWFISENGSSAEIAQIPGKKDSSSVVLSTGEIGNWLLGITTNSANKELSLELIKYLTSESVQRQALSFGGIPTRKSIFRDKEILKEYPFFDAIYLGTNNSRVRPRTTKWSKIEDVFGAELVKCLNNEQSIDQTIVNSQKAIELLKNE